MEEYIGFLILLVVLLLLAGLFSASETALFSLSKASLERIKRSGMFFGKNVQELLSHPRELVITLVFSNEILNGSFSVVMAVFLHGVFKNATTGEQVLLSTICSTFVLVLFGDLVPKSIGLKRAEMMALAVAIPIKFFFNLLAPVRYVFIRVVDRVIRLFGGDPVEVEDFIKEEEFRRLVDESYLSGQLDAVEADLIHKVFDFGDQVVGALAKDIRDVSCCELSQPITEIIQQVMHSPYSRMPVYKKEQHNIVGVLHKKVLLKMINRLEKGGKVKLAPYLHRPVFLFPKWGLDRALKIMRQNHSHMAFTVNEYGDVIGVLTLDDLLQQIFGKLGD